MEMTQAAPRSIECPVPRPTIRFSVDTIDEKARILEILIRRAGHRSLNHVRASVTDGWIVLRGRVPSYYLKQLAQEAVRPMAIGMQIRNELHVGK